MGWLWLVTLKESDRRRNNCESDFREPGEQTDDNKQSFFVGAFQQPLARHYVTFQNFFTHLDGKGDEHQGIQYILLFLI